jgi:hypothetical protein
MAGRVETTGIVRGTRDSEPTEALNWRLMPLEPSAPATLPRVNDGRAAELKMGVMVFRGIRLNLRVAAVVVSVARAARPNVVVKDLATVLT